MRKHSWVLLAACISLLTVAGLAAATPPDSDVLVTNGSPQTTFAQNKQNEPAVTVDPAHPQYAAAGSNDEIDLEACNAGNPATCPFTQGVGLSGIYLSSTSGNSWTQPTYSGWSARDCLGPAACTPHVGPIGTLPGYYENGLVADGDPALAFGPRRGTDGHYAWANGSRLYYANLTSNFATTKRDESFKGFEAIAVSRSDTYGTTWMDPVIASRQNSALFADKEAIWADNAEQTSPFFGNVYACFASFRSVGGPPEPIVFLRSTDGGTTWDRKQISASTNNQQTGGRQDCTIRTDSQGTVYVYWIGTDIRTRNTVFFQTRSSDGGVRFERPRVVVPDVLECGLLDPNTGRLSMDGVGGARAGSAPSVDIANGAPSGTDATDQIVITWCQGPTPSDTNPGPNETAPVWTSRNGGNSFQPAAVATTPADRPFFPAIGISPDGTDVYVTYTAFMEPWQHTTAAPRPAQGVVRHADVAASSGVIGPFADLNRGPIGDARGSSQNNQAAEFLGDYNYVVATRDFGLAVWNDVRGAADCPAEDAYRQSIADGSPGPRPAPNTQCPPTFGNSDIYGGSYTDPS